MAAIHDLIAQIGDVRLRERLAAERTRATRERKFGLVFEEHLPELLPLPRAKPRKGDLVAPRGGSLKDLRRVRGARGGRLQCVRPQAGAEAAPEAAARRWAQMTQAWGAYCAAEGESRVWPVLVVQVENASGKDVTRTSLADALAAIESALGRRLHEGEGVHTFTDCGDLDIGGRRLRRVEASRIDADKNIGVVFFKTSLSTGWDCPRAEVMMSFRRAEDHTHIARLLGRMVRSPLARRIARDAALNDVHQYLPHYDTTAVQGVLQALENVEDVPPAEAGSARELVVLARRPGTQALFDALAQTVTYRVGAVRSQSALRRCLGIARELTIDELDDAAWDCAKQRIALWLADGVARLKAAGTFDTLARPVTHVRLTTPAAQPGSVVAEADGWHEVEASDLDIERLFQEAGRVLTNGLHKACWEAQAERDSAEVKVEVVVLCRDAASMAALEQAAEQAFDALYDRHKRAVSQLDEAKRRQYDRLRLASARPADVPWCLPESIDWRRTAGEAALAQHLFVDAAGQFPCKLVGWEPGLLAEELARGDVAGWLRNMPASRGRWRSRTRPARNCGRCSRTSSSCARSAIRGWWTSSSRTIRAATTTSTRRAAWPALPSAMARCSAAFNSSANARRPAAPSSSCGWMSTGRKRCRRCCS